MYGCLGASGHLQLHQDRQHVVVHGLLGQVHRGGDLAFGESLGHMIEDDLLQLGERAESGILRGRGVAEPFQEASRDSGVDEGLAGYETAYDYDAACPGNPWHSGARRTG